LRTTALRGLALLGGEQPGTGELVPIIYKGLKATA